MELEQTNEKMASVSGNFVKWISCKTIKELRCWGSGTPARVFLFASARAHSTIVLNLAQHANLGDSSIPPVAVTHIYIRFIFGICVNASSSTIMSSDL